MTFCLGETSLLLASFATIKGLSDEKKYKSPYQILGEFIRHIISTDKIYSFSATEIKNKLNSAFGFTIPEAVIRTTLKHMAGISLKNNIYSVTLDKLGADSLFLEKKRESDQYSDKIINELIEYISTKTSADTVDERVLTRDLINFLINDQSLTDGRYAELISEFILINENNKAIQDGLNRICEGSILYMGLCHNIREIGSITKPLTMFLSTEILFSIVGYNGEIFKQLANDFLEQVRAANSGGAKKITLCYFAETKKEISDFFAAAEYIIEGKQNALFQRPAMKAILDGSKTTADITVKQSDFFTKLKNHHGIIEDTHSNYYDEAYFTSNLENLENEDDSDEDYKQKKEEGLRYISHIYKLRGGKSFANDLESEYIFVTNSKTTLSLSKEHTEQIKNKSEEHICGLAVTLDRITSMLWYKLGGSFAQKQYPSGVQALLKARVVVSANIASNVRIEFLKAKQEYESNAISKADLAARILALRNKPDLPEDIQGECIEEIIDFSPAYLIRFEEEIKNNKKSLEEKEKIIEKMERDNIDKLSKKDEAIELKNVEIQEKDKENRLLKEEIDKYEQEKREIESKKNKRKEVCRFIISYVWKIAILVAVVLLNCYIDKLYDSKCTKILSPIVNIISLLLFIYSFLKPIIEKLKKRKKD